MPHRWMGVRPRHSRPHAGKTHINTILATRIVSNLNMADYDDDALDGVTETAYRMCCMTKIKRSKAFSSMWDVNDASLLYICHQDGTLSLTGPASQTPRHYEVLTRHFSAVANEPARKVTLHWDKAVTVAGRPRDLIFLLGVSRTIFYSSLPSPLQYDSDPFTYGRSILEIISHDYRVTSLAVCSTGRILCSGDEHGYIKLTELSFLSNLDFDMQRIDAEKKPSALFSSNIKRKLTLKAHDGPVFSCHWLQPNNLNCKPIDEKLPEKRKGEIIHIFASSSTNGLVKLFRVSFSMDSRGLVVSPLASLDTLCSHVLSLHSYWLRPSDDELAISERRSALLLAAGTSEGMVYVWSWSLPALTRALIPSLVSRSATVDAATGGLDISFATTSTGSSGQAIELAESDKPVVQNVLQASASPVIQLCLSASPPSSLRPPPPPPSASKVAGDKEGSSPHVSECRLLLIASDSAGEVHVHCEGDGDSRDNHDNNSNNDRNESHIVDSSHHFGQLVRCAKASFDQPVVACTFQAKDRLLNVFEKQKSRHIYAPALSYNGFLAVCKIDGELIFYDSTSLVDLYVSEHDARLVDGSEYLLSRAEEALKRFAIISAPDSTQNGLATLAQGQRQRKSASSPLQDQGLPRSQGQGAFSPLSVGSRGQVSLGSEDSPTSTIPTVQSLDREDHRQQYRGSYEGPEADDTVSLPAPPLPMPAPTHTYAPRPGPRPTPRRPSNSPGAGSVIPTDYEDNDESEQEQPRGSLPPLPRSPNACHQPPDLQPGSPSMQALISSQKQDLFEDADSEAKRPTQGNKQDEEGEQSSRKKTTPRAPQRSRASPDKPPTTNGASPRSPLSPISVAMLDRAAANGGAGERQPVSLSQFGGAYVTDDTKMVYDKIIRLEQQLDNDEITVSSVRTTSTDRRIAASVAVNVPARVNRYASLPSIYSDADHESDGIRRHRQQVTDPEWARRRRSDAPSLEDLRVLFPTDPRVELDINHDCSYSQPPRGSRGLGINGKWNNEAPAAAFSLKHMWDKKAMRPRYALAVSTCDVFGSVADEADLEKEFGGAGGEDLWSYGSLILTGAHDSREGGTELDAGEHKAGWKARSEGSVTKADTVRFHRVLESCAW